MRKASLTLISVLFIGIAMSFGQQGQVDSLESLANSLPADTTRVWMLNKLVDRLRENDNNKALLYAIDAQRLGELLTYKPGVATALEHQGWIYYRQGRYSKSLDYSMKALKLYESLNTKPGIARALIGVAAIHFEQKQFDVGINTCRHAYELAKDAGEKQLMARSVNNIAYGFVSMNQADSAVRYASLGVDLAEQINDNHARAFALRLIGDVWFLRGDQRQALKYLYEALSIAEKDDNNFMRVSTLQRMGKVYNALGDYARAVECLKGNIVVASRYNYREELERTYKTLASSYAAIGNTSLAFLYQSRYIALHDSLYDQKLDEQIALMEGRFRSEMKEAEIDLLTKDSELKNEEIERQKLWLYSSVGSLILFILLVIALLYINRTNRAAKREAEKKNKEIQYQAEQLQKINTTKDKLFSIISHDLRSPLASLKALMELVGTPGLGQDEFVNITLVLRRNLDSVHEDLDNLLLWAQTQLKGLQAHPQTFSLKELTQEKIDLFHENVQLKNLKVENRVDESCLVFADRNHISIVLRNLLANAIKFNPTGGNIIISSNLSEGFYEIAVSDSGVGISIDDMNKLFNAQTHFTKPGTHQEKGAGIGLLLTREFVESNKGSIWVSSEVGKGTTFTFTIQAHPAEVLV